MDKNVEIKIICIMLRWEVEMVSGGNPHNNNKTNQIYENKKTEIYRSRN